MIIKLTNLEVFCRVASEIYNYVTSVKHYLVVIVVLYVCCYVLHFFFFFFSSPEPKIGELNSIARHL